MKVENDQTIKTFQRKTHIWFGTEGEHFSLDFIWKFPLQMYLEGDTLYLERAEEPFVLNGKSVDGTKLEIKEGDVFELDGLSITFFKDKLEVLAEENLYETTLLPVKSEEAYFEGFPYYKRSPRVAYRIQPETVEVKNPPKKKEMSKGSLAQMIIPPLCMMALTIAMGVLMKRGAYVYMTAGMTAITLVFSIQRYITEKKEIKQENKEREEMYDEYLLIYKKSCKIFSKYNSG